MTDTVEPTVARPSIRVTVITSLETWTEVSGVPLRSKAIMSLYVVNKRCYS